MGTASFPDRSVHENSTTKSPIGVHVRSVASNVTGSIPSPGQTRIVMEG